MKATVLSGKEISEIVNAQMSDPFELLGLHPLGRGHGNSLEIRTFCPFASEIQILAKDGSTKEMKKVHPDGLFVWQSPRDAVPFAYTLVISTDAGDSWESRDPYSFLPQLGELDLHLFTEGKHLKLYDCIGARVWKAEDIDGVLFSVWAPNARWVSVSGSFNDWDRRRHPMRSRGSSGVWELFVPELQAGDLYKYVIITGDGRNLDKADPLALFSEIRPATASVVTDLAGLEWSDNSWITRRSETNPLTRPLSVYEVHAASWRRPSDGRLFCSWDDLARELIPWVEELGFTHIELLPITEHPFDGSWGYQTMGFFSPTSRFGSPADFAAFVNTCHTRGIGVILDWTPAHFPTDEFGLAEFDGTCLYEHADPRMGRHPDWDTLVFNYDRAEVRNFLLASALFWFEKYHIDGLRVDAVASMLYRDYSRKNGEWIPNEFGGNENFGAVSFLQDLNTHVHGQYPGALVIAEESTAWPAVSRPVDSGGLGFTLKWNMGWMNDTLEFFSKTPVHRKHHIDELTFSMAYAYSENFLLPLSHDEVVHGKGSLISRMPGDRWQQFANLRLLLSYQWAHPGRKLLFMGAELAQWSEWNHDEQLDWNLLEYPPHQGIRMLVTNLNRIYRETPALYELDSSPEGFRWVDFSDQSQTIISFLRLDSSGGKLLCIFNMTPVPRDSYRIGVPDPGEWVVILNTDAEEYGGSGAGSHAGIQSEGECIHGFENSITLTLPPLAAVFLMRGSG